MWSATATTATTYAAAMGGARETGDEIVIGVAGNEAGVGRAEREVEQVVDDVADNDDAPPAHAARRIGRLAGFESAVAHRARLPTRTGDRQRRPEVCSHGQEERDPQTPQDLRAPEKWRANGAQALSIGIELLRALEHLEVPEQVSDDEQEQDQPGHGHDDLLADQRAHEAHASAHGGSGEDDGRE